MNGVLRIEVLNGLRAPEATADAKVYVSVAAADDFRLAGPNFSAISKTYFDSARVRADFPSERFNFTVNTSSTRILAESGDAIM